jgi:hypothetical protein
MRIELSIHVDETVEPRVKPSYGIEAAILRAIRHSATEIGRAQRRGVNVFRRLIVLHKAGTISLVYSAKEGAEVIGSVDVRCFP